MKILIYKWINYCIKDLEETLMHLGHTIEYIEYKFTNFEKDDSFYNLLINKLKSDKFDFILSFNFFQIISNVCDELNVKYVSWVLDSPTLNLYSKSVFNRCNYIFIFDRALYEDMLSLGVRGVHYLPLAVNVERLDHMFSDESQTVNFQGDVSFVGNLYDRKISYDALTNLPDYIKGYLEGIMQAQLNIYGYFILEDLLRDDILESLRKHVYLKMNDEFIGNDKMIYANTFLGIKVTAMERKLILEHISKLCHVNLYTNSKEYQHYNVWNRGYANYYNEMPKIFRYSKININSTMKTIKTGIPLRIFDVLGAGGFLITNYQTEIPEYFEIDKDLVIYESMDDLLDKVRYYLKHEDERKLIANNGYEKVKKFHNYKIRVEEILKIVFDF